MSRRNLAPTSIGSDEGWGKGRPLTLRFNYLARLLRSSPRFARITSSTATRGVGVLSFPRTTSTQELMCVSISCLKVVCWDHISSCFLLRSRISACSAPFGGWRISYYLVSCNIFLRDKLSPLTSETLAERVRISECNWVRN